MPIRELSLAVVGVEYANKDKSKSNRRFEIALCLPGDPVSLIREPKNPKDPNAVAVFSERDIQIGYVTAERAPFIGARISSGEEVKAIFQDRAAYGAVIRVAIGGGDPVLPPPPEPRKVRECAKGSQEPAQDWWPDEIPPDD